MLRKKQLQMPYFVVLQAHSHITKQKCHKSMSKMSGSRKNHGQSQAIGAINDNLILD
jgi:hypothetical protein